MAATGAGSGSAVPPNFFLTPQQQSLLFTALNANKQQQQQQANSKTGLSLSPTSFKPNPLQSLDGAFQESPFLDHYDYDFGDSSFDFSFANDAAGQSAATGDVQDGAMSAKSDSTETDNPEKRNHPDDEEDDAGPGNESKRQETSDKVPKKPGRKPLTSEPTSVRPIHAVPHFFPLLLGFLSANQSPPAEAQGSEPSCSACLQREKGEASQGS
jgi:AP-1-like factor